MEDSPQGYDVASVEQWVRDHVAELKPPFQWTRLEGGHSNLTYRIRDTDGKLAVIRRPPLGELLPKAHDMGREWALISALQDTDVPVPRTIAFCESTEVTGAFFYIMGMIDGHPLYSIEDVEKYVPEQNKPILADSFIDVLASLHSLDPDELGLGDLGKRDSYVARQIKTWYRSWTASVEPAKLDDERTHTIREYLLEHLPDQGPIRIVHGDYGLHNTLIGAEGKIAAVVDWEISTLGDPLADLAYALNQWGSPEEVLPGARGGPTTAGGFPKREYLADRYARKTGRDLSKLDYYVAFNRWKSACIVHGVYARYMAGQKSTEGVDVDALRAQIDASLTRSTEAIARLS